MNDNPRAVGAALRESRVNAQLTQQELAERSGVSLRTIRSIEHGRTEPRRTSIRLLAGALGLAADELVDPGRGRRLRIDLLGPLSVTGPGGPIDLGPLKQRCIFALLALNANHTVSRDDIVDTLWGEQPPATCANLVHTYVSGLRRILRRHLLEDLVTSAPEGYVLVADPEEVDLLRFDALVAKARLLVDTDAGDALDVFEQAVAAWRGPVLAGLPAGLRRHPLARAVAGRRLASVLEFADLALPLGRHHPAVTQLRQLADEEPLHEGVHARLMLALAGSGQQAAALRLFEDVRARLCDELGIEPGAELRDAHARVLRDDLPATATNTCPAMPLPAQLPAAVPGFVGREPQLSRLDAMLAEQGTTMAISVLEGQSGAGKTALAVHWAQRVRDRFPDGQLFLDLRGCPPEQPVRPAEALARFLRSFGLPDTRIPTDQDEAAALYRSQLAGSRVLIVLDNAADAAQVRPLLPGGPGCAVIVTSRKQLTGLAARDGAEQIPVDALPPEHAHALLAAMIGPDRAAAEPAAVAEVAKACGYLPTALRTVGAGLAAAPDQSVARCLENLRTRGLLNTARVPSMRPAPPKLARRAGR
ncbi:BTAD domain-containing putative transcriptional regulator [Amycolatopsis suaedae]|uniref:Helix-turn-helix domain-containing protein n=1 Tax=Amycolatopsis suaedae TaxID=2510978 RepID=A0A4Q7J353_9PSEU|nr:BTAD domain-containing putative transcriptional regulator [Amycolatopsis suaedae]RZQ61900.1 helix-turn-helix domain-containing protein [Amycolatopsis suaedae]